jgi:pimeloyl-ACP methyl ester carboxylesterase
MSDVEILRVDPKVKTGKPPVVFVHGMWHGAWCWEGNFMRRFAEAGFPCLALSLPGHGASPGPKHMNSLRIKDYVGSLGRLVDSLDALPILVGHSMGGRIIQKYQEKAACAAAILVCPVPSSGLMRVSLKMIFSTNYVLPSLLRLDLSGMVDSDDKVKSLFLSEAEHPEVVSGCRQMLGNESMLAFIEMLVPLVRKGNRPHTPMLIFSGGKDALFSIKEGEATARKYGAEHVVCEGLPHDMMLDKDYALAADHAIRWLEEKALSRKN